MPRGSAGVQAPEIELKLIDAHGNEAPDEGELLIRCPYVCLGYYNEPEITRAKLNDGWLRTGDIFTGPGRLLLFPQPRRRHVQLRRRERLSEGGREPAVRHPDVVNAVVAPVPHPVKGFVPAAMVIPRAGSAITAEELKTYCLDKGPAYSHPRFIDIVPRCR